MSAAISGSVVGALACQRDSYLKSFATKVISCQTVKFEPVRSGKTKSKKETTVAGPSEKKELYEVELEDTILFPEGGGQPSDVGYLVTKTDSKKIPVSIIKRVGLKAVHIVEHPLQPGEEVDLELNWQKRFDHMQQHTGQHLLSAIMDKYGLNTVSWNMGDMINYVEVPRKLTEEEVSQISDEVNNKISENIPITVEIPHQDDVKKDKMPADYDLEKGVLRVIHIGDLDANPCCGTHLSSTGQIKAVILLNQVSGKGSNSRLNFLVGDRVIKYTQSTYNIVRTLVNNLTSHPDQLIEKVAALNVSAKKSQSREQAFIRELAIFQATALADKLKTKDFVFSHRSDVGLEWANQIFKELSPLEKGTVVLMTGEGKEGGAMIAFGDKVEETVSELKKILTGLKGGGKGKFQGKISAYNKGELESAKRYLESL